MKPALALCILLALSSVARAQEQSEPLRSGPSLPVGGLPPGSLCLSARVFPGDRLDIIIPLAGSGQSERPAASEDLEILAFDVEGEGAGGSIRLGLRAWRPGVFSIDAFMAGGEPIGPLSLRVESSLAVFGSEPRGQRRALLLPGTGAALAFILSGVAAAALLVWSFMALILPRLRRLLSLREARRPYRRFLRDRAILERRSADADGAYFYELLSRSFRAWAAARVHPVMAALSAPELAELGSDPEDPLAAFSAAAGVLGRADMARFAGQAFGREQRLRDLEELSRLVKEGEDDLDIA